MMKGTPFFISILLLVQFSLLSQGFSKEWGMISKEEYEMEFYSKDKEAEALVLYDIGESRFERNQSGFDLIFSRRTRVKIFTDAGFDFAEVEIPLYQEGGIYETAYDIEGYTYTFIDGRVEKTMLDPNDAYKETINQFWVRVKFVLPKVKEGSIIEYRYKLKSQHIGNLQDWQFQHTIPTLYSEYTAKMIPFYGYTFILQGANSFDYHDVYEDKGIKRVFSSLEFNDMVNIFKMTDIPAFKDEEFITSINDYIIKLDFQLATIHHFSGSVTEYMTTWEGMIEEYLRMTEFGKFLKQGEKKYGDLVGNNLSDTLEGMEKALELVGLLKANYTWNGMNGRIADCTVKELINKKTGNAASLNLLLTGLLRGAGFDANPVLISTRSNGKIPLDYPLSSFFNYVIVVVHSEEGNILLDATESMLANDKIPPRCINDRGLIMNKEKVGWVSLQNLALSRTSHNFNMKVENDSLFADAAVIALSFNAFNMRKAFGGKVEKLEEELNKQYLNVEIDDIAIANEFETEEPFKYSFKGKGAVEILGNKMYISPFLGVPISENPLKQKTRTHPIDMVYPVKKAYQTILKIPEGYVLEYSPSNYKITNKDFSMVYSVIENDGSLYISFFYAFNRSVYPAVDYLKLKLYYDEVLKKATDKIVLVQQNDIK